MPIPPCSSSNIFPKYESHQASPASTAFKAEDELTPNAQRPVGRRDSLQEYSFLISSGSTLEPPDSFKHTLLGIFNSIGALRLNRSNRRDLSNLSDGSIHEARDSLNNITQILLAPPSRDFFSVNQFQRGAASITANYYAKNQGQEAFCHEHAELVLDGMSRAGLADGALLLKILDKTDKGRSHVLVIYAGGPVDDASYLLKPFVEHQRIAPLTYSPPGMDLETFANHIANNTDKIRLIDAWGTEKLLGFPRGSSPSEVKSLLYPMIREGLGWDSGASLENKDFHVESIRHPSELRRAPENLESVRRYIQQLASSGYPASDVFETIFNEIGAYKILAAKDRLTLAGHLTKACKDNEMIDCANFKSYLQSGSIHISESYGAGRRTFIPLTDVNRPF